MFKIEIPAAKDSLFILNGKSLVTLKDFLWSSKNVDRYSLTTNNIKNGNSFAALKDMLSGPSLSIEKFREKNKKISS